MKEPSVTNSIKDEVEEDLASAKDSAYFSLDQSCYQSEYEALEVNKTALDITSTSFTTSPTPILTTNSLTSKSPKKSVTVILPQTRTKERPFGVHLQLENVTFFNKESPCDHGDISLQVRNIKV